MENGKKQTHDPLTGLWNFKTFLDRVTEKIDNHPEQVANGEYAMVYCDIMRFKIVNDMFGVDEGDRLLKFMSLLWQEQAGVDAEICRVESDRFAILAHKKDEALQEMVEGFLDALTTYPIPHEIVCNIGIYVVTPDKITARAMVDRAIIAQEIAKGDFVNRYNFYDESQRDAILGEQEIVGMMITALEEEQFVVYYQPQYDHVTRTMVGAEALVRWLHPTRGLIPPDKFIPIFEKNGFITNLDRYVFEQVCKYQKKCLENGSSMVPISVNLSRRDLYRPSFAKNLNSIRLAYDVPVQWVRLEITESAVMGGLHFISQVLDELHEYGYIVEMDDFGSGYSSLNVLKSIPFDILKLDMEFLSNAGEDNNGGIIVSSVIRMAKWMGFPVIAEGVELENQADYLQSVGCRYMQGYLYSKPLPQAEFDKLLQGSDSGETIPPMNLIDSMNATDFWNPDSLDTLIFSNYVGGAAIFELKNGKIEVLRVNKKYVSEIACNQHEQDILAGDSMRFFDDVNSEIYFKTIQRAIDTGGEEECETWRTYGNGESVCIRSTIRMLGQSLDSYLFYGMIRNITTEKKVEAEIKYREKLFTSASEQVNIYYWDYNFETKEMRPCFRCMRDFNLAPTVQNYPQPLIDIGVFQPQYVEMYCGLLKELEEGREGFEVDIPLTADLIPFRVRYTTEFDENGKPVKAFASAVKI